MAINGQTKCFELSLALLKDGASVTASSGTLTEDNIIDFNPLTKWQSEGSDDTTTETLTILFQDGYVDLSRLFLINHNLKAYTITPLTSGYIEDDTGDTVDDDDDLPIGDDGGTLEFQNVYSITNRTTAETGISETDYGYNVSYYEFDSMYCYGITITMTQAQAYHGTTDREKYIYDVVPTNEVNMTVIDTETGTFLSWPELQNLRDFNSINNRRINGKYHIQKQDSVFTAALRFTLNGYTLDSELFEHLRYRDEDFLIWPNGGRLTVNEDATTPFFRFNTSPFKLTDLYRVQVYEAGMLKYFQNIYSNAQSAVLLLRET